MSLTALSHYPSISPQRDTLFTRPIAFPARGVYLKLREDPTMGRLPLVSLGSDIYDDLRRPPVIHLIEKSQSVGSWTRYCREYSFSEEFGEISSCGAPLTEERECNGW